MFNQLFQLVEQHASDLIVNNPAIPNQHNNAAIQSVTQQILSELQNHASSGNLQQIVSLFQSGGGNAIASHPIVTGMITSVAGTFSSQYGVSQVNAQNIASSLLPTVMNQLVSQTNNPANNNFTLSSVLQSVGGNGNPQVSSLLNQISGNSNSAFGMFENLASKFFGK